MATKAAAQKPENRAKVVFRKAQPTKAEMLSRYARDCVADFQNHLCKDEDFSLAVLDINGVDHGGFHVFRACSSKYDLVFKANYSNMDSARFEREILNQQRLFEYYRPLNGLNVSSVRYACTKMRYFVMDFVAGRGMQYSIKNHINPLDEDQVFHLAGRWIGAFHNIRGAEPRHFDPLHRAEQILVRLDPSAKGYKNIYLPEKLKKYTEKLIDQIPNYTKNPDRVVLSHGDFHSDNLIFSGKNCTGIDFYNVRRTSAGSDIARILVHADLSQFEQPDMIGASGLVQSHCDAFFGGYGMKPTEHDPILYLIKQRILELWSQTAVSNSSISHRNDLLERLETRSEIAFS